MFESLKKSVEAYQADLLQKTLADLQEQINNNEYKWHAKQYLTPAQQKNLLAGKITLDSLQDKIAAKIAKRANYAGRIAAAEKETRTIESVTVTIVWKKSATWGNNPRATVRAKLRTAEGYLQYETYESSSVGGCGYDKGSTAVAEGLNQCTALLRLLYSAESLRLAHNSSRNAVERSRRDYLGYGSGYGPLPAFEGGVGVSSLANILENLGFHYEHVSWGKAFDVYQFTAK